MDPVLVLVDPVLVPAAVLVEVFLRTMVLEVGPEVLAETFLRAVAVTFNHVTTKEMSVWT